MKKMINYVTAEGYFYKHDLTKKVTGPQSKNPGTHFISGTVDIATNDSITNIITFRYTYVTATTSSGKPNPNYKILSDIIDGKYKSVMQDGKSVATKFSIFSTVGLNEFYDREGELVSAKINDGGKISVIADLNSDEADRCMFYTDMLITGARQLEANEEKGLPERVIVKGYIFNWRNEMLPVEYTASSSKAMDYFLDLAPTEKKPLFTKVWGRQVSLVYKVTRTEDNAFGESKVVETERHRKEYTLTGGSVEPYEFDDETTITKEEIKKALADREVKLATEKKRREEYVASKVAPQVAIANDNDFNF